MITATSTSHSARQWANLHAVARLIDSYAKALRAGTATKRP
jgi:hypothetical protein